MTGSAGFLRSCILIIGRLLWLNSPVCYDSLKIKYKTYLQFWALVFFSNIFGGICSLVYANTGHNHFLVSYKLFNNGFSFNQLFLGFVTIKF